MTVTWCFSALADRHRALGSGLEDWNGMGTVWTYARRVQCVRCKGITEDVIESPIASSNCGLNLLVRDHYSRRLAAYQSVGIDAEELWMAGSTSREVCR